MSRIINKVLRVINKNNSVTNIKQFNNSILVIKTCDVCFVNNVR